MVNIMAQGLSTPDPSLRHTPLYKDRSRNNYTLHTHGVALYYTIVVAFLWLRIGPAWQRWHAKGACATPKEKERKKDARENNALKRCYFEGNRPGGFPKSSNNRNFGDVNRSLKPE